MLVCPLFGGNLLFWGREVIIYAYIFTGKLKNYRCRECIHFSDVTANRRFSTTILRDTRSNLIPPLPPPGLSSRRFASRRLLTRLCPGGWRACRTCGFCTGTFKLLCTTYVFSKENGRQTIVTSSACTNADVIKYKRPRKRETAKKMFLKNTIRVKLRVFSRRLYAY